MTGPVLHIDFETRSTVDLKKTGVPIYARHHTTSIWCMGWAVDDMPVQIWRPGQLPPKMIVDHVKSGGTVTAHNFAFEWHIWNFILPRFGFPPLDYRQGDCTAARAAVMGLPRDLEGLARDGLGLAVEKDMAGRRLMLQMMKPRRYDDTGEPVWWDDKDRIARLSAYCATDVAVEREADKRLRPLTKRHRETWLMDFELNYIRGVQIDLDLVHKAQAVVDVALKQYDRQLSALTGGQASKVTKVADLTRWIREQGVEIAGLGKDVVADYLKGTMGDLPEPVRQALQLRQEAGKSSLGKLPTIINRTNEAGRTHDLLMFNGAGPGRWSGRGIQLHNLPRPSLKHHDVEYVIEVLKSDREPVAKADILQLIYGSAPQAVSDAIRGMVVAAPGKRLFVRDFSNIEGRCIARIAGEQWKLKAFAEYDAGTGPDLYKLAIAGIMGIPVEEVDDFLRQIGKVSELSLGYEGGVNAFVTMAKNYGVKIGDYFDVIMSSADSDLIGRAEWGWEKFGHKMGLDERSWLSAETVKLGWRAKHPAITALWKGLVEAAVSAMRDRGTVYHYRDVAYQCGRIGGVTYLICKLPSGRLLYYPHARLELKKTSWGAERETVTYWGVDSVTRKWVQSALYGGLAAENCLAGDSLVLTRRGWIRLEEVRASDEVHDGVEFVKHGGLLYKSVQPCVVVDGVQMTADHKVLTDEGWKPALEKPRPHRPAIRGVKSAALHRLGRQEDALDVPVRVRIADRESWRGSNQSREEGPVSELRVQDGGNTASAAGNAWHEPPPGLRRVVVDAGALSARVAPSVQELRGPRRLCLRALDFVRALLGRHGADLSTGADAGPRGQRRQLRAGELPLGDVQTAGAEQARVAFRRCGGAVSTDRDSQVNAVLPTEARSVFDILNCGPRSRFVVLGHGGPFIVHNCTQADAYDFLVEAMHRTNAAGYPPVLSVHDEVIAERAGGSEDEFHRLMAERPWWAPDMPLSVEGFSGGRYRK